MPTNDMIKNLFEVERGYINTRHPDFLLGAKESIGSKSGLIVGTISDDEADEADKSIIDKSTAKKGIALPVSKGGPSPTDKSKTPGQKENGTSSESFSPTKSIDQTAITPKAAIKQPEQNTHNLSQPTAFTGLTHIVHLHRIPDRLVIEGKPSKREKNEINLIKRMITSYFDVVKKNVNDLVPKTIITFFIKKTIDLAEKEMVHNLYDEKMIESVMKEDQDVVNQRGVIQSNISVLRECLVLMNEFEQAH